MSSNTTATRALIQRFVAGNLSRREFVAGALGLGLSGATVNAVLAGQEASPSPPDRYPLTEERTTLWILVPSNPSVENFETNEFTRWYEERTNVHLEWEVVPEQDAQTGLNVRLAAGDLPDVIMGFRLQPSLQTLYGAQGVFLPL